MTQAQSQEEETHSGIPWGKLTFAVLPFLIAAGVLVWLMPRMQQSASVTDSETILAEGEFSDRSQVEILDAVAAKSLKMESRRRQPRRWLMTSGGSFTYAKNNIDFKIDSKNGVFESVELQRESPSLILVLRIRDLSGADVVPEHAFFAGEAVYSRTGRDTKGIFDEFVDVPAGSFRSSKVDYEIEVEDGEGGWLRMSGPITIDGQDGRVFAVTPVFPRRSSKLKLRVRREGLEDPVVVEIPNPGHDPAGFPSWTIDPKPWRKELSEVAVVVDQIEERHLENPKRILPRPDFRIEPLVENGPVAFNVLSGVCEDETGNRAPLSEFRLLPGTDKLRFFGKVERSRKYPWTQPEVQMIAETVWTGQDSNQVLTLLSEANRLGLESMTLSAPSKGTEGWHFAIAGRAPRKDLPNRFRIIVFLGDEEKSFRISGSVNGSSRHLTGGIDVYDYSIEWRGEIETGKKVRIGLLPDLAPEEFNFIIPIDPKFIRNPSVKGNDQP